MCKLTVPKLHYLDEVFPKKDCMVPAQWPATVNSLQ